MPPYSFAEQFDFFEGKARRTKRLEAEILRIALAQSAVSASRYLRASVVDIGKSSICTMLKKLPSVNRMTVTAICIDDFALKKRQRYGTIMVDIERGKIIDMIASREASEVARWLKEYPNLQVISRDGSIAYGAAIAEAHPNAMQISDRFHIVKNLTSRMTRYFQKLFQGRIAIPATTETLRCRNIMNESIAQRVKLVVKLHAAGRNRRDIGEICDISVATVKRYLAMRKEDIPEKEHTVRGQQHLNAVAKRHERAERVRYLHAQGLSFSAISKETGFGHDAIPLCRARSRCTKVWLAILKYLDKDFSPVNAHYGKLREGKLQSYREEVLELKARGLKYREIHEIIHAKGYTGTQDAIRGFISKERRIYQDLQKSYGDAPIEWIDKQWLIRLLYKTADELKGITQDQLSAIFKAHPMVEKVLRIVHEFRVVLKSHDLSCFNLWMEKAAAMKTTELDAFIAGLKQDLEAVNNAVITDYSNGLAEGSINKLKVIKRIMYGRCSFRTCSQ